jgi:hypothetical protein
MEWYQLPLRVFGVSQGEIQHNKGELIMLAVRKFVKQCIPGLVVELRGAYSAL